MRSNYLMLALITGLGNGAMVTADESSWQLKPGLRALHFDNKRGLEEDNIGASLGLEYQYGRWGTELQLWSNEAETAIGNADVDVGGAAINQYLYLNSEASWQPYLVVGAGHGDFDGRGFNERETEANLGVGFKHRLADQFSWWVDVRGVHGFDDSATDSVFGVGLAFHFGQSSAKAQSLVPSDADGDGVSDTQDNCPNTPAGVSVDRLGCELDSDRDGVADSRDQCPDSAVGEKVGENGCKLKVTRVEEIRMEVHFNSGATELLPEYETSVQKLAQFMKKFSDLNVIIEGHTDSTGAAEFNQQLSAKRAQAIKNALVTRYAIAASRISVTGYGETQPVASNTTAEGRKINRRVIAVLTKTVVE